ncbi:prephenate dehydrogenase [Planctomicrobium sp. SH664]|uniref:prephenate dehydrogenase n=1 Tax=Planctomicrobium sp. SH664 TaxID=3448125 RepID=UPI003F5B07A6
MTGNTFQLQRLAIVGVGLIGGSLASAAKTRQLAREVIGIGRSSERLQAASRMGIIDRGVIDPADLDDVDLVVVCTPPDRIATDVLRVLQSGSTKTIVTDAGSVKEAIVAAVSSTTEGHRYLGSHPLAGSHLGGFEHSDPNLYQGRLCVITPTESTDPRQLQFVRSFWEAVGMQVRELSPSAHDRMLALTSHLPHLAAAAVATQVDPSCFPFAATGFRDTTRIAAGDPDLWTAIFSMNAEHLAELTADLISTLEEFRQGLLSGDSAKLQQLLSTAQKQRLQLKQLDGDSQRTHA